MKSNVYCLFSYGKSQGGGGLLCPDVFCSIATYVSESLSYIFIYGRSEVCLE